jgi:type II secretory pathway pseudopilin PulG
LIEIIAVVIIVGILASLALPRMTSTFERFRAAEGIQIITALLHAQKAYRQETGSYTNVLANLDITIDNPRYFTPLVANANPIAGATRTGNAYTLNMSDVGVITCTDGVGPFTCANAGY